MSHFAKLDSNNIVTDIIVAEQDFINSGIVGDSFLWIQTSYNGNFKGKYASIGGQYDVGTNTFIPPQPYNSWVLNEDTCLWEAPVARPDDDKMYDWDEETQSWDEVTE